MERTADPDAAAPRLVDGVPRQRPRPAPLAVAAAREPARQDTPGDLTVNPASATAPAVPASRARPASALAVAWGVRGGGQRAWRLLPSPGGTPFTFWYAAVLVGTSLVARYATPSVMDVLYRSSSTDVAHLVRAPLAVLVASALWVAGGVLTAYSLCFLLVLTALERRTGALRAAGVFLLGHVFATLATEVPVGLAVLAGRLPDGALHRLDYGISFGVAASVGALCGLLRPWVRWPVLAAFAGMLLEDLVAFTDPMTSAGHLISLAVGVACWPVLRRGRPAPR
ncbi:rhomboid-like protein [Streptomyces sp. NPDC056160]|uniref:rhomboid-like protein n=1 Tax=Streptomyces sp. NPDC056160 TaxID=3345731 RepID=UPI0035DB9622